MFRLARGGNVGLEKSFCSPFAETYVELPHVVFLAARVVAEGALLDDNLTA